MEAVNEVRLVGTLSAVPAERELPSGDVVVVSRLVVGRGEESRSRQRVDVIDCSGWAPRVQPAMRGWRAGDTVEIRGALRRRFFRAEGQTAARVEIEVSSARLIRRAGAG
ncbi:MAG: single-stranded DNA-binding protein [Nocardioidaceae bacterium]|nr:single-stranded DNA-binding protein [Nocardioidaceae bacterium]